MVSFKQKSQLRSIYHLHPLKPLQNYLKFNFLTIFFKSEINEEVYIDPTFSYNANYIFILNTGHMLNINIRTEFQGVS